MPNSSKPTALPVEFGGIPAELKRIDRWVLWSFVAKIKKSGEIKWDKVPFRVNGAFASTTDSTSWCTFDEAQEAFLLGDFDGIGIVISGKDFHGIDLDDCRDPETGALNDYAQRVLSQVHGYAEVSPSGTGIKIFTPTNLDASRTKKELELYTDGRYFTTTGHVLRGRENFVSEVQDLTELVAQEFNEVIAPMSAESVELVLQNHRPVLENWSLERVRNEILPHLDADAPYPEWAAVGMSLHHQGQGDLAWCELWDDWSSGGSKYAEGECERKWYSFNRQRAQGRGPVTLRHLLDKTRNQRNQSSLEKFLRQIEEASSVNQLEQSIGRSIAREDSLSETDREQLVSAISKKAKALDVKMPVPIIRGWVRPQIVSGFPDVSRDGTPLATIENLEVVLGRMGTTIRYNVVSKKIDLMISGHGFTQDNHDNASLAHVLSHAARYGMPYGLVEQHLLALADKNQYNPVAQWVTSKPWDGISRIDDLVDTVVSPMPRARKKTILMKWFKQTIAAGFSPTGIAAQGILVFQGPQNIGKTRWVMSLTPVELDLVHIGHTLDVKNKDSVLTAISFWITELGELGATFSRSEYSALKAFTTQNCDRIRRPYARSESNHARRTSFFASVNETCFLNDPTGNRRFWVIPVAKVAHDHKIDVQQFWAEILLLWREDPQFFLTPEEESWLNENNEDFTAADPVEERLARAFEWESAFEWDWKTATEVLISIGISNPSKSQTVTGGRAIRKLNGDRYRRSGGLRLVAVPKAPPIFSSFPSEVPST